VSGYIFFNKLLRFQSEEGGEAVARAERYPKKLAYLSALDFYNFMIYVTIPSFRSVDRSVSSPFTRSARAYHQLSVVLYSFVPCLYVRV
jgi:hypothetical protein